MRFGTLRCAMTYGGGIGRRVTRADQVIGLGAALHVACGDIFQQMNTRLMAPDAMEYVLIVGVGDSPGEITHSDLFRRKADEQERYGRVFWYTGAPNFAPDRMDSIPCPPQTIRTLFVQGGKPHGRDGQLLSHYFDGETWCAITGAVTGDPSARHPKVIAFRELELYNAAIEIDLGEFSTFPNGKRVLDGNSGPAWAKKVPPSKPGPNRRKLLASALLTEPFVAPARFASQNSQK